MLFLNEFKNALCLKAGGKTKHYFFRDKDLDADVERLDNTLQAIALAVRKAQPDINIEGKDYLLSDYQLPERLITLIKATSIYMNSDSMRARKSPVIYLDENRLKADAKMMTPMEVSTFFARYNESQSEDGRLAANAHVDYMTASTLSEYCELPDEDGNLYRGINETGISGVVFQILELKSTLPLKEFSRAVASYSDLEVREFYVRT